MATARRLAANVFSGVVTNFVRIAIQAAMLPLMAHLLGPSELGLYALALPIMSFVMLLSDAGLGDSLAREKSDSTVVWSSAFWGLLCSGATLMVIVYAASFFIANVAQQPRLPEIMLPLCATLLMVVATIIPNAIMMRNGNLVPGAIADLSGNLLGAALGITLAFLGFGVWAMVTMYVTTYVIRALVLNIAYPFIPRLEFSLKSLMSHTGMGSQILGNRLMDLGTRMLENLQVSRNLGPMALGGYSYANQIGQFVAASVANPIWANMYYIAITKGAAETNAHYLRSQRNFALMVFPAATLLALAMPAAVPFLLGSQWSDSIYPIMLVILGCPFGSLASFQATILYARNQGRIVFYSMAALMAFRVFLVLVFYSYGLVALTAGLAIGNLLYYLGCTYFVSPIIGCSRKDALNAIKAPFLASAGAGIAFYFATNGVSSFPDVVVAGIVSCIIYAALLFMIDNRNTMRDLSAMRQIIGRRV